QLMEAKDYDGAYAVCDEAQRSNSAPGNYQAACMAGAAALAGEHLRLAKDHLQFACSTDASNPAWVQYRAWETLAYVDLAVASEQMSGARGSSGEDSLDELAALYRRASSTVADADAAMTMAIDIASKAGDGDQAAKYRLERAGLRRVRDNMNALSELPLLLKAMRDGGSSADAAALAAMLSRIDSILIAVKDLFETYDAKRGKAPGPAGSVPPVGQAPVSSPSTLP
ncbi:MAG: hypothetical protein EBU31_11680, partial [Proteobacteria bacterium]|nr:hypothetical protein [Pseudomonadota bacterium]